MAIFDSKHIYHNRNNEHRFFGLLIEPAPMCLILIDAKLILSFHGSTQHYAFISLII